MQHPSVAPDGTVDVPEGFNARHPGAYAMRVNGDCLSPLVVHGSIVIATESTPFTPGQLVVIYSRGGERVCKLLVSAPPKELMTFRPGDGVEGIVKVRTLNPKQMIGARVSSIEAIHGVVAMIQPNGEFVEFDDEAVTA